MAPAVSEEDLNEEFGSFGLELDDPDVVDRLKEFCTVYKLDASEILDEWIAFKSSKKKKVDLNSENLDLLNRERLSKKAPKTTFSKKTTEAKVYDVNSINEVISGIDEDAAESLYNAYSTPSAKTTQKRQHTPDDKPAIKRFTGLARSPHIPFSPASFSPAADSTPSKKYSSRGNAGQVKLSFGDTRNVNWTGNGTDCYIAPYDPSSVLKEQFKYMFQKLSEKAHVLNDLIDDLAAQLQNAHNIEEFSHVAFPAQDSVTVVGRICCDSDGGKINAKSVMLEGSRDTSSGRMIPLDLSQLKEYALFPGQIVALDGVNITGQKFAAKKLYSGVQLPLPELKVKTEAGSSLKLFIAAGPYTTSDCLSYEPLSDLLKYIQRDKPDVCILTGPFVDSKNQEIEKGTIQCTFEELFNRKMSEIEKVAKITGCQMIIIPSSRDVHHDSIYPQPPFNRTAEKNVYYASDPSTLQINGVVFGITSTDVVFHLGSEEISFPPGTGDRLGRIPYHLLTQQSYYPLYPPSDDISIDYEKYEIHARMPITPHVMVIPSQLNQFVKDVKGCCCINPGQLAKGQIGGTYARMAIKMPTSLDTSNQSLVPNIAVEIIRT